MLKELRSELKEAIELFLQEEASFFDLPGQEDMLSETVTGFLRRRGKMLRPLLFMIFALGYDTKKTLEISRLARCAVSIELLHDYFLIHDDIIDNSPLRRGGPAMHKLYENRLDGDTGAKTGRDLAMITGDILHALCVKNLLSCRAEAPRALEAIDLLTRISALTAKGEFLDVVNERTPLAHLTEERISEVYLLKTAGYTCRLPLEMAAAVTGMRSSEECAHLATLGRNMGLAFQLQDDLLDIFLSGDDTGKKALSDLSEGKRTLLAIKAFNDLTGLEKETFATVFAKPVKTSEDLNTLRELICSTSAPARCMELSETHLEKMRLAAEKLTIPDETRAKFEHLAAGVFGLSEKLKTEIGARCE